MPLLILGLLPKWMMREGLDARETLVSAFDRYLAEGKDETASVFMQRRIQFFRKERFPKSDITKLVVADNIAFNSNLVPAAFWLLYHVYSDPGLLRDCRAEVSAAVQSESNGKQTVLFHRVKSACPVLQAAFREVFRVHGFGFGPRRAMEDHMLDNQYLIKKGSLVFIPYRVQHYDVDNWGEDASVFSHRRFLPGSEYKRHNPLALRGFGNGTHLCPGRHFATAEVLLLTGMMILRFDAEPAKGFWPKFSVKKSSQVTTIDQPDYDWGVKFRPRVGVSQEGWAADFSSPDKVAEEASGA